MANSTKTTLLPRVLALAGGLTLCALGYAYWEWRSVREPLVREWRATIAALRSEGDATTLEEYLEGTSEEEGEYLCWLDAGRRTGQAALGSDDGPVPPAFAPLRDVPVSATSRILRALRRVRGGGVPLQQLLADPGLRSKLSRARSAAHVLRDRGAEQEARISRGSAARQVVEAWAQGDLAQAVDAVVNSAAAHGIEALCLLAEGDRVAASAALVEQARRVELACTGARILGGQVALGTLEDFLPLAEDLLEEVGSEQLAQRLEPELARIDPRRLLGRICAGEALLMLHHLRLSQDTHTSPEETAGQLPVQHLQAVCGNLHAWRVGQLASAKSPTLAEADFAALAERLLALPVEEFARTRPWESLREVHATIHERALELAFLRVRLRGGTGSGADGIADPYCGEAFRQRALEGGRIWLWSVGRDGHDDSVMSHEASCAGDDRGILLEPRH